MNDGMLPLFCARAWPRASVRMHAKSLASFESVENDVRTMALAASSTMEIARVHSTSSVTASSRRLIPPPLDLDGPWPSNGLHSRVHPAIARDAEAARHVPFLQTALAH